MRKMEEEKSVSLGGESIYLRGCCCPEPQVGSSDLATSVPAGLLGFGSTNPGLVPSLIGTDKLSFQENPSSPPSPTLSPSHSQQCHLDDNEPNKNPNTSNNQCKASMSRALLPRNRFIGYPRRPVVACAKARGQRVPRNSFTALA